MTTIEIGIDEEHQGRIAGDVKALGGHLHAVPHDPQLPLERHRTDVHDAPPAL